MHEPDTLEVVETETITADVTAMAAKCILYDDDWHTFDEVIAQIVKATGCSMATAERHTLEVHNSGKSTVFHGDFLKCLKVSSVLEEIALHTTVEY